MPRSNRDFPKKRKKEAGWYGIYTIRNGMAFELLGVRKCSFEPTPVTFGLADDGPYHITPVTIDPFHISAE